ncbi:MAG TPA: diacylglycerol kinase family protein, partial [Ardenticatenaceae bacterium]|nr:diacylglycerol kinase family protein [Ardenticatenaceae bacterium]
AGVRYAVVRTERPGHATALAEGAAADGWGAVVAVGGDGTIHEVANGLTRAATHHGTTPPPLGIVSTGTGNDFVKLLGLSQVGPAEATRRLLEAQTRTLDIGRVGSGYFVNVVGTGFDARVAVEAQRVKRLRGMAVYLWALLKALRAHRTPIMRVVLDGQEVAHRPLTMVVVANGACYGGGFWVCPTAQLDDGFFDICVADAMSVPALLAFVPRVMRGTHVRQPEVHMYRARNVQVYIEEPLPVQADGEILAHDAQELVFELWPGGLTVLA